jgi:DNA-binding NtrC family response regulator
MGETLTTTPHGEVGLGIPVRALRVDIIEGPDTGTSHVSAGNTLTIGTADGNDLVVTDDTVSRFHLELSRGRGGVRVVDCGSTNGIHANGVALETGTVAAGSVLQIGKTKLRVGDGDKRILELHAGDALAGLRGRSPAMRLVMSRIERAAASDVSVLVVGESGTGKELVARGLHDLGRRAAGPFVAVDCAALAPALVATELFGHERGAFTGADRQHIGAFERAHGGTLFLDEIGELPPALQASLLGALERRKIRRVGGSSDIAIDVRVASATHRDLRAEVNSGAFRLDLYYRIAVVTLTLPPLRDRPDDLELLVGHFLREAGHTGPADAVFSPAATAALAAHRWPGNVRELRNLVEATLAMGELPPLDTTAAADTDVFARVLGLGYRDARQHVLQEFEARYLAALLERAEGNVSRAARAAGMDRSHLLELLHRHDLK